MGKRGQLVLKGNAMLALAMSTLVGCDQVPWAVSPASLTAAPQDSGTSNQPSTPSTVHKVPKKLPATIPSVTVGDLPGTDPSVDAVPPVVVTVPSTRPAVSAEYYACANATGPEHGSWIRDRYLSTSNPQNTYEQLGCPTTKEILNQSCFDTRYAYQTFTLGGYCI